MNIFQAFEQGEGRATFEGYKKYAIRDLTRFIWQSENNLTGDFVSEGDLRCNGWIPYVPPEERKIEGMVNFNYNYVPRETQCVCENIQSGGRVEVDFNQKCITCGKQFNFVLAKTKTKHKEVFEKVKWHIWPKNEFNKLSYVIVSSVDINKAHTFIDKPPMKMTLEWEE